MKRFIQETVKRRKNYNHRIWQGKKQAENLNQLLQELFTRKIIVSLNRTQTNIWILIPINFVIANSHANFKILLVLREEESLVLELMNKRQVALIIKLILVIIAAQVEIVINPFYLILKGSHSL